MTIIEQYEKTCNKVLKAFIKVYFEDLTLDDCYWIGDDVGGCCDINSFAVPMDTMINSLRHTVKKEIFFKWYGDVFSNPDAKIRYNIQSYAHLSVKNIGLKVND